MTSFALISVFAVCFSGLGVAAFYLFAEWAASRRYRRLRVVLLAVVVLWACAFGLSLWIADGDYGGHKQAGFYNHGWGFRPAYEPWED